MEIIIIVIRILSTLYCISKIDLVTDNRSTVLFSPASHYCSIKCSLSARAGGMTTFTHYTHDSEGALSARVRHKTALIRC